MERRRRICDLDPKQTPHWPFQVGSERDTCHAEAVTDTRETLRIATWNIQWKFGKFEERQPAILETIKQLQPDVIGLQESWPGQVERLAETLGYEHAWIGHQPDDHGDFTGDAGAAARDPEKGMGNAVLSRHPILEREHVFLDDGKGRKYRTTLGTLIATPHGMLPFFSTHLNFRYDESLIRQSQLTEASEFIEALAVGELPPVLVGDLNAVPDSDEIRRLTGRGAPYVSGRIWTDSWEQVGEGPGITWSDESPYINNSAWPNRRLDYVLIGWPRENRPRGNPQSAELFGTEPVDGIVPSDHYGVVVEMITG